MRFSPSLPCLLWLLLSMATSGCGTTRVSDTARTATEQLLLTQAIDETMAQVNFLPLSGRTVFLETQYLEGVSDKGYLISAIRQHLLANGALIQEDRSKAQFVVEARAGAVGTDRHSLLVGVPQLTVPVFIPGQPSQIPEIPVAKSTDQKAYAKIAIYAYNRVTGRPLMQTGNMQAHAWSKDTWILGMGPFQRGTVRDRTEFAGEPIRIPFLERDDHDIASEEAMRVKITQAATWKDEPAVKEAPAPSPETPKHGAADGFASDRDVPVLKAPPAAQPPPPIAPPPLLPPSPSPSAGKKSARGSFWFFGG